jgi:hypothetical protein
MKSAVVIYTSKNSVWANAANEAVPTKFVPKQDKIKEALAAKLHKSALSLESGLREFHEQMALAFKEITQLIKEEYELKQGKPKKEGKGSVTWFNFNRSIKIEADMNEIVKWDNALMTEALALLNSYISSNLSEANLLISELVQRAFANSRGMIDTGKVFQILRYEEKIKNKSFQKACELIKQAQSIDRTKMYMRIWEKMDNGEYRNINLNFSSI